MSFQLIHEPELVSPNDDYQDQINDVNGEEFLNRMLILIEDDEGNAVGEFTGYILFTKNILNELSDSFFVMDGISQLLADVHSYIEKNKRSFQDKKSVLFLNRLSLYNAYFDKDLEEKVLSNLLEKHKMIIYTLGMTELGDKDFSSQQDSSYFDYWEKRLKDEKWKLNSKLGFFIKEL